MTAPSKDDALYFLPLGGAGEIGMNFNLLGYGAPARPKWLAIDCGVSFGDDTTPGVELIMADPSFIEARREDLLGLVLTHAHEDHIGAVPYLWPRLRCPVYATPFTAALVEAKLAEANLADEVPVTVVPLKGRISLPPFAVELVTLTHSIPEPNALAVHTPLGTVLHTGDWKIDPDPLVGDVTDEAALRALGDAGVLAVICDSTNVFVPGEAGSEAQVRESLTELIGTLEGRVAVTAFASNVARLDSVARAAARHGRSVVLVGRSMRRVVEAAKACGYLQGLPRFLEEGEGTNLRPERALYLCTGSQGEPRAALARIAAGNHPNVTLDEGDTVIFSSRIIPGNERAIFALHNALVARGIKVITAQDHFVHVSGHPCRDELARMYQWLKPRIAVPVHGERRHLVEHVAFAKSLQIPETVLAPNGSLVQLAPGRAAVVDEVPSGRLYLTGNRLVPETDEALRERRRIAYSGLVSATLVFGAAGKLALSPRVMLHGIPGREREEIAADLAEIAEEVVRRERGRAWGDDAFIAEMTRRALRKALHERIGIRPQVRVDVVRLRD
jgi:ribonuclease J